MSFVMPLPVKESSNANSNTEAECINVIMLILRCNEINMINEYPKTS